MEIVEASDDESDEAPASKPTKAVPPAEPPAGFKRMQIVEDDDSDEEPPAKTSPKAADPYPDISIDCSKSGIEKGKDKANSLFSQGSVSESVRWFSKCIWLVDTKKPKDVPIDLQSILRSNRAFGH